MQAIQKPKGKNYDLCRGGQHFKARLISLEEEKRKARFLGPRAQQEKQRIKFSMSMRFPMDSETRLLWDKASLENMEFLPSSVGK